MITPTLIIPLVIVLFVTLALLQFLARRKRRRELALWAKLRGLQFDPTDHHAFDDQFPGLACLAQGENRYACNILSGDWHGRPMVGFDYHYETHSHDSKGRRQTEHHWFSAVILSSATPLKPLALRPEHLLDKIAGFLGFEDINFESTDFNRAFHVSSPDRRWAFDVLHPRTMEWLLQSPRFSIYFDSFQVIAWRTAVFSVDDFRAAAALIQGILDRLPDYLVKQQLES